MIEPNRQSDERLLKILALRKMGLPNARIAQQTGVSRSDVSGRVRAIMQEDIRLSGEPKATVSREYRGGWE